ncbi:MAG: hypothetical protein AB1487_03975 [Thermodesulfobacteriota bacterium]
MNDFARKFRRLAVGGKQRHLPALGFTMLKDFDAFAPRCPLAVIYLAKIEHLALDDSVARHSMVLNDAPVTMFFAVFDSAFYPKKHATVLRESS